MRHSIFLSLRPVINKLRLNGYHFMGNLFRFLISKSFFINLAVILALLAGGLWAVFMWLDSYTEHGETLTVPSFIGQPIDSLDRFSSQRELQYVIIDSVYDNSKRKGTVLDQDPKEGAQVKRFRKIYLTVIARSPKMVKLDIDFADLTRTAAQHYFEQKELDVEFEYEPGEDQKLLRAYVKGKSEAEDRDLMSGDKIKTGTRVILVIGQGGKIGKIPIPDLIGFNLEETKIYLEERGLNLGLFEMLDCSTPEDSTKARVLTQIPEFDEEKAMDPSRAIQLVFSLDAPEREPADTTFVNDPNENW